MFFGQDASKTDSGGSTVYNAQGQKSPLMFNQTANGGIILNPNTMPSMDQLKQLLTPKPNMIDIIHKTYWDSVALNSAVSQNWNAFQNAATTNPYNSNLNGSNSQLQGGEAMVVTSLRFEVENDSTSNPLNDVIVKEIFRQSYISFVISNKSYYDAKLVQFHDPRTFLTLNTLYYTTRPFITITLPIPIVIPPQTTFYITTQVVNPTLSGTNYRLFAYINGVLYRGVQ